MPDGKAHVTDICTLDGQFTSVRPVQANNMAALVVSLVAVGVIVFTLICVYLNNRDKR